MKFVFIVVIVCAIALNLSFDFVNSQRPPIVFARNGTYRIDEREEVSKIVHAWVKCNPQFREPFENEIDLFPPWFERRLWNIGDKCVVDCTLRETGMMTDHGLKYSDIFIKIQLVNDNAKRFEKNCFATSAELLQKMSVNRMQFNHYICYEFIWSITAASDADYCRRIEDPEGDDCETSFMIMQCITKEHSGRLMNSSFIPIALNDMSLIQ